MNKPTFTMLVGLPASGKSTYAKKLSNKTKAIICSSDAIREEISGDTNLQDLNNEVFSLLHKRIKEYLQLGEDVIYDATNIHSKRRRAFLQELKNIKCIKKCMVIATPYEECLKFNQERNRKVPEDVIKRMYMNWDTPYWFEGWNSIDVHYRKWSYREYFGYPIHYVEKLLNNNQDNSHHSLSLGNHLMKTWEIVAKENKANKYVSLRIAALLHDIGKPFTKSFLNSKGEITEDAHYYQHQCVGAYDSLFFKSLGKSIDRGILINLHMMPYFWEKDEVYGEKTRLKYKKLWGDDLYNQVMIIHQADSLAH